MNKLFLRASAALACVLSLASCGGSDGNLIIAGSVYGMTKSGLTLSNNGGTPVAVAGNPTGGAQYFQFEGFKADDRFNIQVANQPAGSKCEGRNNVGKLGGYSVSNVIFQCYNLPRNLGGRLSKAVAVDITLNNGKDTVVVPAGQTTFTFTRKDPVTGAVLGGTVGDGEPFGVTVLNANGLSCTVANGTGTMGNDFNDVIVSCQ